MSFFQFSSLVNHWLDAVDEHSIHSPFFFDFYNRVVNGENENSFVEIEKMRGRLMSNQTSVKVKDLGAPSQHFKYDQRTIARVAATSLNDEKHCALFYRIAKYIEAETILELGTSMGITSLYLSKIEGSSVTTFEGNPAMISIARTNFDYFQKKNIEIIEGNIDHTLPDYLQSPAKIDFVLIDANHRYEPTVSYFNQIARRMSDRGIIIVDDIYYSAEMARAWKEIKKHDLVYASVDLFRCGILFFDLNLNKQHYTWLY